MGHFDIDPVGQRIARPRAWQGRIQQRQKHEASVIVKVRVRVTDHPGMFTLSRKPPGAFRKNAKQCLIGSTGPREREGDQGDQ